MTGEKAIVIDSDTESENEDIRRAIELSLQEVDTERVTDRREVTRRGDADRSTPATGLAALNRKKMEQERLERQRKRAREENDIEAEPDKKRSTNNAVVTSPSPPPELRFPKPVVKRTWAFGQNRTSEDVKIEEIFQKSDLQLAILSSFVWDENWLLSKVDIKKTKLMLIAYAPDDTTKESMKSNVPPNVRFCFPPMYGPGAMHSKLQVLKFSNFLRIAIPTGNLMSYDWGETGVMENMVFIVDIPRKTKGEETNQTLFSRDLQNFLEACGIDKRMVESLKHYDFSTTSDVAFVYTQPGGHTGEKFNAIGYPSLAPKLSTLGLATPKPIELDYICSSLGAIKAEFLSDLYRSCQGQHAPKQTTPFEKMRNKDEAISKGEILERFRVYFPTERTVAESLGGIPAAGTICFQEKWWNSNTFPQQIMRDCVNNRRGLLMHSKIIYVRHANRSESNNDAIGWAYVGSANLSESAWGRASQDKTVKGPKLICRNWECGVIIPAKKPKDEAGHGLQMFGGILPTPIEHPGKPYQSGDRPWFFMGPS